MTPLDKDQESSTNKNLLCQTNLKEVCISIDSKICKDSLFADDVSQYDEDQGYSNIENPGWIQVVLMKSCQISYIRFLLWDNRGSSAKRQPSNRKYTYRLLIAEKQHNSTPLSQGIVWTAIYENSLNPSNGWQEFYFEDGVKDIQAIKIQFFQNTSASNKHKSFTQLVSLQAYKEPTLAIKQLLYDDNTIQDSECAPIPAYGFIRNRVIIGGEQDAVNNLVENEVIQEVANYIETAGCDVPELKSLRDELVYSADNGRAINNDIERQIHIFNRSILKPIEAYDQKLSKRFRTYAFMAMILFGFGIVKELVEIFCLYYGVDSPLSVRFILDLIFK